MKLFNLLGKPKGKEKEETEETEEPQGFQLPARYARIMGYEEDTVIDASEDEQSRINGAEGMLENIEGNVAQVEEERDGFKSQLEAKQEELKTSQTQVAKLKKYKEENPPSDSSATTSDGDQIDSGDKDDEEFMTSYDKEMEEFCS